MKYLVHLLEMVTICLGFKEPTINLEETFRSDGRDWPYPHIKESIHHSRMAAPKPMSELIESILFKLEDHFYADPSEMDDVVNIENGYIKYKDEKIIFVCFGPLDLFQTLRPLKDPPPIKMAILALCNITKPITHILKWLNVDISKVEELYIYSDYATPLPPENYTQGLDITSLFINSIHADNGDFFIHNPDFMQPLITLTSLVIWGTKVPPLPKSMKLETFELKVHAKVMQWDNCEHLTSLNLFMVSAEDIPEKWPTECRKLISLRLRLATTETFRRIDESGIHVGCENLRYLILKESNSRYLPMHIINAAKNLTYLDLSFNKLIDRLFINFTLLVDLHTLDLSYNDLTGWFLYDMVKQMPHIRNLKLDRNNFLNLFCNLETTVSYFTAHLSSVEWLSMDEMSISPHYFANLHFSNLSFLSLRSVQTIPNLKLMMLPTTNATHLTVDLQGSTVNRIDFDKSNYETIHNGTLSKYWNTPSGFNTTNLTLLFDIIECDCENYWFARALRDSNFISMPGLRCKSGNIFLEEPIINMDCEKEWVDGCLLRINGALGKQWKLTDTRSTLVDCHNRKHDLLLNFGRLYRTLRFVGLNASDNSISSLKSLLLGIYEWVDLRRNQISRLNAEDVEKLFTRNRSLWLSDNPFICDCKNRAMLDGLQKYYNQIHDFYDLKCIETGKPLHLVSAAEICQDGLRNALIIGGVWLGLLFIAATLIWRYRLQLKIFLYSRGLCMFCFKEKDKNSDKIYDAFLSYAHADEDYAIQVLMRKLEDEYSYRICVHYRNWVVGDWIPAQIARSVSVSKRTIIVLSRNFVDSLWGSLEFRYAVASSIQDGRHRIIVLVLDDVLSQPLSPELKGYLSVNTYLRCDDPWFWDKLRYAMPHRKQAEDVSVVVPIPPIPIGQLNMTPLNGSQSSRQEVPKLCLAAPRGVPATFQGRRHTIDTGCRHATLDSILSNFE